MSKKQGIIEKLKAATTTEQVAKLAKKLEGYAWAAPKTIRKFKRVAKSKQ
jgi:hypothetical protein